jgi:hypothetical protein
LPYKIEYRAPGGSSVTALYQADRPLQVGQWISLNGVYLAVERIVKAKPGDSYAGIALCKLVAG